jgi:hypothetical protein
MAANKNIPPKIKDFLQNIGDKLSQKKANKPMTQKQIDKAKRQSTFANKVRSNALIGGTAAAATVGAAYGPEIGQGVKTAVKKTKKAVKKVVKSMQSVEPKRNKDGVPMRNPKK